MTVILCISFTLLAVLGYIGWQVHEFWKYEGKMLVTCPETGKPAAVRISLPRAVWASMRGRRQVELFECSRWPERADCDQDCLCEIESNPEAHKAWTFAAKWFAGKDCTFCGKDIEPLKHLDRSPALLNLENKTFEWNRIPTEELPEAFEACKPVCWSCHIAETFVREHPDMVTYRPWKKGGPLGEYAPEKDEKQVERRRAA